jgi:hypothetical protein
MGVYRKYSLEFTVSFSKLLANIFQILVIQRVRKNNHLCLLGYINYLDVIIKIRNASRERPVVIITKIQFYYNRFIEICQICHCREQQKIRCLERDLNRDR